MKPEGYRQPSQRPEHDCERLLHALGVQTVADGLAQIQGYREALRDHIDLYESLRKVRVHLEQAQKDVRFLWTTTLVSGAFSSLVVAFIVALLLSGCIANRTEGRQGYVDPAWAAAYIDTWEYERAMPPEGCGGLDDIRLVFVDHDTIQGRCNSTYTPDREIEECSAILQDLIPPRVYLEVRVLDTAEEHPAYFVGHALLHHLRTCWWRDAAYNWEHFPEGEALRRLRYGAQEGQIIHWPADPWHQDCSIWRSCGRRESIEYRAQEIVRQHIERQL